MEAGHSMSADLVRGLILQTMEQQHYRYETMAARMDWPLELVVIRLGGRIPLTIGEIGEFAAALGIPASILLGRLDQATVCGRCRAIGLKGNPPHWTWCPEYARLHPGPGGPAGWSENPPGPELFKAMTGLVQPTIDEAVELVSS